MLGIVVSRADSVSVHIGEHLLDIEEWERHEDDTRPDGEGGGTVYRTDGVELREFDERHLDMEQPADVFDDPTLLVFASRHAGETEEFLTAHHTGNFGPADHGGADNDLARACPNAHARVLSALEEYAPAGYDVGMECTHHGPSTVGAPSMFVELGSGEPQWEDSMAARAVARAILDLRGVDPDCDPENGSSEDIPRRHLVGFGGGHYTPRFERVVRETDWTVGHVAADWGLDAMGDLDAPGSKAALGQAFEQSAAAYALVDGDRPAVEAAVETVGYRAVSETWVRETDGVPLEFVHEIEENVLRVDDGLRFGQRAESLDTGETFEFTVEPLPDELLDEARGIDPDATRTLLRERALAFGTDHGGTRVAGPAVLGDPAEREIIIDRLLDILAQRYDSVERDGDRAIAREQVFDPERAKTLGIPEGPAFGKLADGQTVEVNGETIPPEVVETEREQQFSLSG